MISISALLIDFWRRSRLIRCRRIGQLALDSLARQAYQLGENAASSSQAPDMFKDFPYNLSVKRATWALVIVLLLSAAITLQHNLGVSFPLTDAFHSGEFVAAAMAVLVPPPFEGDPYTIHGASDFFPALLARLLVGQEHIIAYTVVMYGLMSIFACFLIGLAAVRIAKRSDTELIVLAPFFLLIPFCVDWRDLLFALSLLLFSRLVSSNEQRGGTVLVQLLFGFVVALGTYWSYNRGVAALVAFGPVMLWLSLYDRRHLVSILVALVAFPLLGMLLPGISVWGYIQNLFMLFETSSKWAYPPYSPLIDFYRMLLAIGAIAGFVAAVIVAAIGMRLQTSSRDFVALYVALIVAAAIYLKIGLGRIDFHVFMGTWLPLLIALCGMRWGRIDIPGGVRARLTYFVGSLLLLSAGVFIFGLFYNAPMAMVAICLLLLVGCFLNQRHRFVPATFIAICTLSVIVPSPLHALRTVQSGGAAWIGSIRDLPANDDAVSEQVLWAAREIADAGSDCVFDLSNSGLINAVAGLPSCSRFTYPVYANSSYEDALIADLRSAAPPVVLYWSTFWSYSIDRRPMSDQFPTLNATILRDYPRELCNFGACLRYRD